LRICIISTYPPIRCGVAYYTEKLVNSLKNLGQSTQISVLTDEITENDPMYPFLILKKVIQNRPSVIHFQHEYLMYGFYGIPLIFMILILRVLGYPTIVTLHTVLPMRTMDQSFFDRYGLAFLPILVKKIGVILLTKLVCKFSSIVTVHTNSCKLVLRNEYHVKNEKIAIVPHGRDSIPKIPKEKAKHMLKLNDEKIMLCIGFIKPDKGFERAIEALRSPKYNDYTLVVAGTLPFRHSLVEEQYVKYLHGLVHHLGLERRVMFIEHFLSETEIRILFSAADVVYLPYKLETCGASGIYHLAKSFGSTIITSKINRFSEDLSSDWNSVASKIVGIYLGLASKRE